jgi:hypothetical protein
MAAYGHYETEGAALSFPAKPDCPDIRHHRGGTGPSVPPSWRDLDNTKLAPAGAEPPRR